jgi:hypothetical protein
MVGRCDNGRMGKGRGPRDPFGTYREWADHRYDPGHYLGGTLAPHLRKSELGRRARRYSGALLILGGFAGMLMLVPAWQARGAVGTGMAYLEALAEVALPMLAIAAGIRMLPARRPSRRPSRRRDT